jgi:hypothetical protein
MKFESGASRNELTGTDSLSWKDKSWVIGVKTGKDTRAYDWNQLKEERVIMDTTANPALFVVLSADNRSFSAFERPSGGDTIQISNDTILYNNRHFRMDGRGIDTSYSFKPLPAYQEFWHSWKTFNPDTHKN